MLLVWRRTTRAHFLGGTRLWCEGLPKCNKLFRLADIIYFEERLSDTLVLQRYLAIQIPNY